MRAKSLGGHIWRQSTPQSTSGTPNAVAGCAQRPATATSQLSQAGRGQPQDPVVISCLSRGMNVLERCKAGNTPAAPLTTLGVEFPPLTSALCNTLQDLLFLLQLLLLGRLLPSWGESEAISEEVAVPSARHPALLPAAPLPSAFSLRCWCWSRRLMLDCGPRGMSSSSPRCSLPLSRCSSSDTTFRRICSSFCSCKEAGRDGGRGSEPGGTLGALPRQRRAPLPSAACAA